METGVLNPQLGLFSAAVDNSPVYLFMNPCGFNYV